MKTDWDYTNLADAYLKRPDYASEALLEMLSRTKVRAGDSVCDVGAGVAHLTIPLAQFGLNVVAVEPNDAMRSNGIERTSEYANVRWVEGSAEDTGQPDRAFDLVTFGSSFNVTNRNLALKETARILKSRGWFSCMWNHRNLEDPLQRVIEHIIQENIPDYQYGSRREDQRVIIESSGLFDKCITLEGCITHRQSIQDCLRAWESHATLAQQAGNRFEEIIRKIERLLLNLGSDSIEIPYTTRIWLAQLRADGTA